MRLDKEIQQKEKSLKSRHKGQRPTPSYILSSLVEVLSLKAITYTEDLVQPHVGLCLLLQSLFVSALVIDPEGLVLLVSVFPLPLILFCLLLHSFPEIQGEELIVTSRLNSLFQKYLAVVSAFVPI